MARVIRRSRWIWLRWGLFLLIVGVVLAVCGVLYELDFIIHQRTTTILQEQFIDADVSIASAHLVRGEGIELSRFMLLATYASEDETTQNMQFPPVIRSERVMVRCPSRLDELINAREFTVENIIFDTATIHTYRRPDGSWSLSALRMNPKMKSKMTAPVIQFRNTSIVLHDMTDTERERKLVLRNVEMTIEAKKETSLNMSGLPSADEAGVAEAGVVQKTKHLPFRGTAETEFCRKITFLGRYYPKESAIVVEADIPGLQYSEDFRRSLPIEIADRFSELRYIRGQIDVHAKVASSLKNFNSAQFRLDGNMTDGRSTDPRFPKMISNLATNFQISNEGYVFPNFTFRYGSDGLVNLEVKQRGYGETATKRIRSQCRRIEISEAFYSILPENIRKQIRELSPTGQLDMDAEFLYDGRFWSQSGTVHCSDINLTYTKFPYRLEHLKGEIQLREQQVQYQFQSPEQGIQIFGNVAFSSRKQPQHTSGTLQIRAQNVPVDANLLSACPHESAEFLRSLEISGNINVVANYQFSQELNLPKVHSEIKIELLKNSCRYRDFPYSLRDLEGFIQIQDRTISTTKIRGVNNNAEVVLSFHAMLPEIFSNAVTQPHVTTSREPIVWEMQIQGRNITLDEELYDNLPGTAAEIFRYIQPYGTVNIHYEYSSPLRGQLLPRHQALWINTTQNGIRLSLPAMSYWLDNFQGRFQYQNGQISLSDFSAEHNTTRFSGNAVGRVENGNQWNFHFQRLTIDGVRFERDLMGTIPEEARVLIASKRPEGALYYNGQMDIHYDNHSQKPFSVDWHGELGIVAGAFSLSFPLTAINGGIEIFGHLDQEEFYCGGELDIDSLFQQNIQFTQVKGPLWIDNKQLLLGGSASQRIQEKRKRGENATLEQNPHSLRANFVGGDIYGAIAVQFGYPSTFQSQIILTNGYLENCAYLTGNDKLKGRMYGSVTLTGSDSSLHTLNGSGEFHLEDADIYKLSVMMSLLKILSLKEVNDTGFSSSDMKFRIEGNHIYFDQMNFYGDAFSLIGKGEMDFKSQVKLVFYSVMGSNNVRIPILSPLLHATGRQMLLITMKGPIQNPEITQQPLPALNMALEQMEENLPPPPMLPSSSRPGLIRKH